MSRGDVARGGEGRGGEDGSCGCLVNVAAGGPEQLQELPVLERHNRPLDQPGSVDLSGGSGGVCGVSSGRSQTRSEEGHRGPLR